LLCFVLFAFSGLSVVLVVPVYVNGSPIVLMCR